MNKFSISNFEGPEYPHHRLLKWSSSKNIMKRFSELTRKVKKKL